MVKEKGARNFLYPPYRLRNRLHHAKDDMRGGATRSGMGYVAVKPIPALPTVPGASF
jgi:hypothetical protein